MDGASADSRTLHSGPAIGLLLSGSNEKGGARSAGLEVQEEDYGEHHNGVGNSGA